MRGQPFAALAASDRKTLKRLRIRLRKLTFCQPRLEFLENRVQPGDAFFGGFWGFGLLGLEMNRLDPVWEPGLASRPSRDRNLLVEGGGKIHSGIALSPIEVVSNETPPQPPREKTVSGPLENAGSVQPNDFWAMSSDNDFMMAPMHSLSYSPQSNTPPIGHEIEIVGGLPRDENASQSQAGLLQMATEKQPDLGRILLPLSRSSPSFAGNIFFDRSTGLVGIRGNAGDNDVRESITQDGFLELVIDGRQYSSNPASASCDRDVMGATVSTVTGIRYENGGGHDTLTLAAQNLAGSFMVSAPGAEVHTQDIAAGEQLAIEADRITVSGSLRAQELRLSATGLISVETAGSLVARDGDNGGRIDVNADIFVTTGQLHADGINAGHVFVHARNILNAGQITADGNHGVVGIAFTGSYIDTTAALTSATSGHLTITGGNTGRLYSSGKHQATGVVGGSIDLLGRELILNGATVDASGQTGGGFIRVGGDFQGRTVGASFQLAGFGSQVENLTYREGANAQTVTVTAAATIRANALQSGDGGRIVVWSDQRTEMDGTVSAQGGSAGGNGGFIEVSGKGNLNYGGSADAGARHGKTGTLLLDPKNIIISEAPAGVFPQFNFIDPHPTPGGRFGIAVSALSTGKVVVTSPFDNFGGTFAGAVYLFDGVSGALLSSLVGSNASDQVGSIDPSGTSGVFILDNSNTGVRGTISDANSLVGTNPSDNVGGDCFLDFTCITLLSNGNYVVRSPEWNGRRGAVTWGNGTTGVRGAVSAANSLIGSNSSERIGFYRVTVLNNGNYVVQSSDWNNRRGAVTWGNGQAGVSGTISEANSLVGTNADDQVGYNGVTALSNGNYVVRSIYWNDRHGAVTWGDGQRGVTGTVSDANSLTGSRYGDTVGDGIIPLTNGNYLVQSEDWNGNRGAVTWGDGTHAVAGPVDASNSLVGSNPGYTCIPSFNPGDCVGDGAITALSNGNYVVASPLWDGQRGAATWGSGTTGVSGIVSETNSLVGTNPFDQVGVYGAMPLNNGNYVVLSPFWNTRLGAATWGSGAAGVSGVVSADNSLVGSSVVGSVGSGFVTGLSNGNYLVMSPNGRGAVTWGNGTAGVSGLVSADNSLVGSNPNDFVGTDVTRLSNGNYVVSSPNWNGLRGAVTWGSGAAGVSGQVSADNSLVGSNPGDQVGDGPGGVTPFANGNYAVTSWALGGAVTWGSGSTGVNGAVSTANSLVGTGGSSVTRLSNSNYVVASPNWSANRGAVTWVSGTTGQTLNSNGFITPQNSLVGTAGNAGLGFVGENTTSQTFLAAFVIEGSGRLTSSFVDPNQLSYNRGQSQTVTITPGFLTNTLNTGTDVTLQASNDITIEDPIIVRAGGKGGALTLQAGRSIILNASISTDNGSLTLIANDTLANGVVDSQRDPGNAFITMAGRTQLNTGTGRLNIELRNGAGRTYTGSRSINLQTITAGSVKVVNNGPSTGSDVILGPVTSNGPQTYSSPNGTTFVSGNVTAADSPITFADSVVVDDRLRIDAGSNKIRFNSAGTQNLQTGSGDSFGNVDHNGTGTLQLAGPLNISGTFTNSAGTFDANDQPVTVSGLATLSAGTYRAGTAPQTLLGGLVIGAGTFTSSTGPMSVNGTVAITGGSLAGEGTVGPLTVVAGTLIPGAGGPGILTVGGSVALFFGSTFTVRLNGFEPGTSYSQLVAEGPIFLGGSTLNLVLGFEPPVGRSFEIVQGTAPDPISGTFAGLDEGAVFEQGGFQFQITYIGGNTANSVVLTRLA